MAGDWAAAERKLARDPAAARTFLPGGRAPRPGDIFQNENLAKSLELIAKEGRDAFYKGAIAQAIRLASTKASDPEQVKRLIEIADTVEACTSSATAAIEPEAPEPVPASAA